MTKSFRMYWDADVFISYFGETPGRIDHLEAILEDVSRNSSDKIVTSSLTQVEVAKIYRHGVLLSEEQTDQILDQFWADDTVIEIIEVHPIIAQMARDLIREAARQGIGGLRANDAVHLATAVWANVDEINSYEDKWQNRFSKLVQYPICEPIARQLRLPGT